MSWATGAWATRAWAGTAWAVGGAIVQPILPITKPSFRSIDAKSIADVYNRGQPDTPDYEFANRRKFYQ